MASKKEKYHRRADGLLESTRTDKRTGKRIHFYGHTAAEIDTQIMAYTSKSERGRLFEEVAQEWRDLHFPTLAANTLRGYRPAYQRALNEFGNEPIRQIKPQDIKRFLVEFSRGGRAKKTVTTQRLILSLICGYAVESGDIEYSPCDHVTVPKNLPKSRREAASTEDEQRVKDTADVWLLPYLILYTGLRRGEALALTYNDIDRENWVIYITKSVYHVDGKPFIKRPKTEKGNRTVPILDPLKKVLPEQGSGYLFSIDGGEPPLSEAKAQTLWRQYARATGVTATPHQLRHPYVKATTKYL